jgi:DNA invertase Pin-like site-specific DNA recombinase
MNSSKIQRTHCERLACVYVRQSTPGQVAHHQESTERQYRLRERALMLGWPANAVAVIDEDQGRSGRAATHRTGFQHLVSQVSLGQVGLVLMLEASRLARNNADWHALLEISALRATLIADEDAVYDPRDPNDRLLLGMKGILSEAEVFTLRMRLHEGRWHKARKGLLRFPLPVGYCEGPDGRWELDPDAQVRARLDYVFAAFRRYGVARAVLRDVRTQHLDLPTHVASKEGWGTLVWKTATLSAVMRLLTNPAYAGAYVYGRADYATDERSPRTGKAAVHRRAQAEWAVCLQDHHPGYLPWGEYLQNQERLHNNWPHEGRPGVAREGAALLQGIVWCGVCGQQMTVQHHAACEDHAPAYLCDRGYRDGDAHICQSMTAPGVDAAVSAAFLEAASPLGLAVSLQVLDRIEAELAVQRRQQELQLDQARYEARLAQRAYDAVDPEHRLVAAELERRWNDKLTRVADLERTYAQANQSAVWTISAEDRAAIGTFVQDLPALWQAASTTHRDRKQLLRCAIETVVLDGISAPGQIEIQVHWRSGTITTTRVARRARGEWSLHTPTGAIALIGELAPTHEYAAIAAQLTAVGWRTAFGREFTSQHVGYLCRRHGWARGQQRTRDQGSAITALS